MDQNSFDWTALIITTAVMILILAWVYSSFDFSRSAGIKAYGRKEFQFTGKYPLVGGLDLPANMVCSVVCLKSGVVFLANQQEFFLAAEKLVDVSIVSRTQLQNQYVSGFGAAAGTMPFIPAALGGMAGRRTVRSNSIFLIFTYRGQDEIKYISFDVTGKYRDARRFETRFKSLKNKSRIRFEL